MGGPRTVLFRGHLVDPRTAEMLTEVESIIGDALHVWQGSYSNGSKSGGTHSGGGAVDVSPTKGSWDALVAAMRQVGFAAWHRTTAQGYDPHVHAIAVGCVDLSPEAAQQVAWYREGLNGLWPGRQGPDDGPRDHVGVTWETYQEDAMPTAEEVAAAVLGAKYAEYVDEYKDGVRTQRTIADMIYATHRNTVVLAGQVGGLAGIVAAMSKGNLTAEQVIAAAKEGAEQALSEGVKVDVSVGGAQ